MSSIVRNAMSLMVILAIICVLHVPFASSLYYSPDQLETFSNLVNITTTFNIDYFLNSSIVSTSELYSSVLAAAQNLTQDDEAQDIAYLFQVGALPSDLAELNLGTFHFLLATNGTLNFANALTPGSDIPEELGLTIAAELIADDYNAPTCAGSLNYTDVLGEVYNVILVNGTDNCTDISQTAYQPCNTDTDCADGLFCNSQEWFVQPSIAIPGFVLPTSWCVPVEYPKPVINSYVEVTFALPASDDAASNALYFQAQVDSYISLYAQFCGTAAFQSNVTSFDAEDVVLLSLEFYDASYSCRTLVPITATTLVDYTCAAEIQYVPGLLNDTVAIVANTSCGLLAGGLTPCQVSANCTDGLQCGLVSAFENYETQACQANLQTDFYDFNISIVPTPENQQPDDFLTNYAYLSNLIAELKQVAADNECLFIDSVQVGYIPQIYPYQTASLFISHLNISGEDSVCQNLTFNSAGQFILSAAYDDSLFTPTVQVASTSTVAVADCIDSEGQIILAGTCTATQSATDSTTTCSSDSDCSDGQVCQAVPNTDQNVCYTPSAVAAVNFVKWTVTVPTEKRSNLTASAVVDASEQLIDYLVANSCIEQSSTYSSRVFPLEKPYNVAELYYVNATISSDACANINLTQSVAQAAIVHHVAAESTTTVVGEQLSADYNTTICYNDTSSSFNCDLDECLVACSTTLYASCETNADCASSLRCQSVDGSLLCVNAAHTMMLSTIAILATVLATFLLA